MSSPLGTRPPLPPEPPEPPFPRPTPWLPDIRPTTPGPVSANASVMVGRGTGWTSGCSTSASSPSPANWTTRR